MLQSTGFIYSVQRQQNMPLHDRIVPYLERANLYHLARLNARWFWLDEPLDVAYQLELLADGLPVFGCLKYFEKFMEESKPAWEWFQELVLPDDATEETVRIYARAYIMILLSTQLFGDKSGNRVHIRWLFFMARLDDMGSYSWGWVTYFPASDRKEERAIRCRLALDRLGDRDIVWEPYASIDVMTVVHLEILTEEHSLLWCACTCLIYFAVIEWHQVDRVLPQLDGVQHELELTSNIDWIHAKDGRGGDR
ncbi:uncharacterized protein DS421_8g248030 [Arachis hypogaea]|nr:uncharacterized protein DS421_8g248030 [Arachis hypogaea]